MIVKLFNLLKKIIRKLVSYIFFKEENLILEAPLKLSGSTEDSLGYNSSDKDPEFIYQTKKHFPHKYKLFKKRLQQNLYCYRVYNAQNTLVAYTWIACEDYYEPIWKYTLRLKPKQIYQFDGFLSPEERKGMLANLAMKGFWNHFFKKGYTSTIAAVNKSNMRNLKFHAFTGFEETGEKIVTYYIFRVPFTVQKSYSERYFKVRKSKKPKEVLESRRI